MRKRYDVVESIGLNLTGKARLAHRCHVALKRRYGAEIPPASGANSCLLKDKEFKGVEC